MSDVSVLNLVDEDIGNGSSRAKVICKFVLLINKGGLNLVFGPLNIYPYHANLVNQFCLENDIASIWEKKPDFVRVLEQDCEIKGGGWMEIDPFSKQMKFFGRSTAYGLFDPIILAEILTGHSLFGPYHVTVRHK